MGRQLSEAIVDGILGGSVYALMAVGLTLIFGVLDIINIAQGILVVLGAYLSYVLSVHLHLDLFVGLLVTVPAMFIVGVAIQWAFIRPLRGRERTSMSLLATYAVAIIIEGVLYQIFGSQYVAIQAWYVTSTVHVFGFYLPYSYLIGCGLAVVALGAIYVTLYRTKFGRSVRAIMQDKLLSLQGCAIAPPGESGGAARKIIKNHGSLKGYLLRTRVEAPRVEGDELVIQDGITMWTYPGGDLKGSFSPKLRMQGAAAGDRESEDSLLKMAIENAVENFAKQAASM